MVTDTIWKQVRDWIVPIWKWGCVNGGMPIWKWGLTCFESLYGN